MPRSISGQYRLRGLALIVASATAMAAVPSPSEPLRAPLIAEAAFHGLDGEPLTSLSPAQPFEIQLQLTNVLGSDPPAGLELMGWLRPQSASNLSCNESARSFMATGRLPTGAIELNGPIIAVASTDGALTLVDPDLDLATANLIGAQRLAAPPHSLVADEARHRLLATLTDQGQILAIQVPSARSEVLADSLAQPVSAWPAADGSVWALTRGDSRVVRVTTTGAVEPLAADALALNPSTSGDSMAVAGRHYRRLLDTGDGEPLLDISDAATDAIVLSDLERSFALAAVEGDRLSIHYADAADATVEIMLPAAATRLATGIEGRWILAWNPAAQTPVWLIDVARGRVLQALHPPAPIVDIAFTEFAAYLMTADQQRVGVLDLSAIRTDRPAQLREVALGKPRTPPLQRGGLLASLWPGRGMLAVHAESYTGFMIDDYSMMGDAPPMSAIRLRGGVPALIEAYDRSFRETRPGRFVSTAVLDTPGEYELVTTTGIGALSFCAELPMVEGTEAPAPTPGTLTAEFIDMPRHNAARRLHLTFRNAAGTPLAHAQFTLLATALGSPWRSVITLNSDARGRSTEAIHIPDAIPVVVVAHGPTGDTFHPLILEAP